MHQYYAKLNAKPLTVPDELQKLIQNELQKLIQKRRIGLKVTELQKKADQLKAQLRSIERQIKQLQKSVKDK